MNEPESNKQDLNGQLKEMIDQVNNNNMLLAQIKNDWITVKSFTVMEKLTFFFSGFVLGYCAYALMKFAVAYALMKFAVAYANL